MSNSGELFLKKIENPYKNFKPDFLIILNTSDTIRNSFINNFADALCITDFDKINYSNRFKKVNHQKSITEGLTSEDFLLNAENIKSIKKILIIDDTIDKGRTVSILLEKLIDKNLISDKTEVKLICVYQNKKQFKLPLKDLGFN